MSPFELSTLCIILVGGGEMAQDVGIGRVWALALSGFVSLAFFVFRRAFGELFASRLIRFLNLPSQLIPRLLLSGQHRENHL